MGRAWRRGQAKPGQGEAATVEPGRATGDDFACGALTAGPMAQRSRQDAQMEAYGETQGDVMVFSAQDNAPLFGPAGDCLSTAFALGAARLNAQASATDSDDVRDASRSVTSALASAPVSFAIPVLAPATDWTDLRLDLTAEAGPSPLHHRRRPASGRDGDDGVRQSGADGAVLSCLQITA